MPIQRVKPKFSDIKNVSIAASTLPAGSVIQRVVHQEDGVTTFTASGTSEELLIASNAADSTSHVSLSITPSATSSKVLILVNTTGYNSASGYTYYTIYRDSSNVASNSSVNELTAVYGDGGTSIVPLSMKFLDSPNTTSQVTYQAYFKVQNSTGYFNVNGNTGSIILMEIGA